MTLKRIKRADTLLVELVELNDRVEGVGDPYYKDLYEAIIDRAREIIDEKEDRMGEWY